MMLFHEVYSCYYRAVAAILSEAVEGELTEKRMRALVDRHAFSESFLEIIPALTGGKWKLLYSDLTTPLQNPPTSPLTELQLRWMKAISLDPRMRLFNPETEFLRDIEPLFLLDDYILFDQYNDGDPYDDPAYIASFQLVLQAVKQRKRVKIAYTSKKGTKKQFFCDPFGIEYSEKDDKFRLRIAGCPYSDMLNIAGIDQIEIIGGAKISNTTVKQLSPQCFTAELVNERNALERFLLHFSHFKKEAEELECNRYRVTIYYDKSDETELVIRILSFGPFVKVCQPDSFVQLIKERLMAQRKYNV